MSEGLRFSTQILRRLGEELNPHPDLSLIELVRNSYDADATKVIISLEGVAQPGGTVRVVDNGDGMNRSQIRQGFFILGASPKEGLTKTRLGRSPIGEKGLGRLAALRLGSQAEIRTRPRGQRGTEFSVLFDWMTFDEAVVVEDVPLTIKRHSTTLGKGTSVEIRNLTARFTRWDVRRLARSLLLLRNPFTSQSGFNVELESSEFDDLQRLVRESYFDWATYRITGHLTRRGTARATMTDQQTGREVSGSHKVIATSRDGRPYAAGVEATFEVWAFLLASDSLAQHASARTVTAIRRWLEVVGGVHIYHRGLRVHPYGDEGHDWLDMNLRRARSPEERPSTNNSIGRVMIKDDAGVLVQKTDRSGFIEDEPFVELRHFGMDVLDWAAKDRLTHAERRRARVRRGTASRVTKAEIALEEAIRKVPPRARPALEGAVTNLTKAAARERRSLLEEVQLYRTLSTVGTTTAVFAHEGAKPALQIEKMALMVQERARALLDGDYEKRLRRPLEIILRSSSTLQTFSAIPLRLLERKKRTVRSQPLNKLVDDAVELFRAYAEDARVELDTDLGASEPRVRAAAAAIESIVSNLLINAVRTLQRQRSRSKRLVVIRTSSDGNRAYLTVMDNGPGIRGLSLEAVWLPGQTTVAEGSGLGLTIVRDTVADLGGNVRAIARGQLGGAEFIVEIPVAR